MDKKKRRAQISVFIILGIIIVTGVLSGFILMFKEKEPIKNIEKECSLDSDCVPDSCCHSSSCIQKDKKPQCDGVYCTMECQKQTLDCNQGDCKCLNGKCGVKLK